MTQYFNNRTLIAPQAEVSIQDTGLRPVSTATGPVPVGILGYSTQGLPDTAIAITSVDQALNTFGQGSLVDGITRAFTPGVGDLGAQTVYGIRVNAATPGFATLSDGSSNATHFLLTRDAGVYTRSLSIQLQAATGAGTAPVPTGARKATTALAGVVAVQDNLGYNVLTATTTVSGNIVTVAPWSGTVQAIATIATPTLVVTTAVSGMHGRQLVVGQQLLVDTGALAEIVTIQAVSVSGANNTLTLTSNLLHGHAATVAVTALAPSLLLYGASTADQAGFPLANYGTLSALAAAATATSSNWSVTVPVNMNQTPGAQLPLSATSNPAILDYSQGPTTLTFSGPATSASTTLTGISQAVSDWINGGAEPYFNAQRLNTAWAGSFQASTIATATSFQVATNGTNDVRALIAGQKLLVDTGANAELVTISTIVISGTTATITCAAMTNAHALGVSVLQTSAYGTTPQTFSPAVFASGGADDASGGSLLANNLTVTNNDWQNALNALQGVDAPLFVLMSGTASIHALGDAHAAYMSREGKMERIQIAGGVLGETDAQVITRAQNLNSFRSCLVYPGIQDYDPNGILTTYPPYYAAASLAGLASGTGEPNALTNQKIRIQGLEVRTVAAGGPFVQLDYDNLLQGGVMPIQYRPGLGYVVVQSLTTWQSDSRYTKRELSVRRIADRVARTVRENVGAVIGSNVSPSLINAVHGIVDATLSQYTRLGYLVGDSTYPAYQAISVTVQQGRPDTILVSFQASPAIPANYILITAHLTAYGSVASS